MLYKAIYSIIISSALNTILIITPITMGINILIISIVTAFLFAFSNSSWIAFLIFLVYIRGTLVIFSYFLAITPNSTLSLPIHTPLIIVTPIIITTLCLILNPSITTSINSMITNTFYTKQTIPTLIILALILLITIIIVVKVASTYKGPLRPFNYA
jgi:hypothetical protein